MTRRQAARRTARARLVCVAGVMCVTGASVTGVAQRGAAPAGAAAPAASASSAAPFDLTGYWVSIVSDEWRYRMLTPPKGSVDFVPVTDEGRRVTQAWDPARDRANGDQCKAYGPAGVMRLPSRLHITWQDPSTLRIDIDTGTQTRLLRFQAASFSNVPPSLQGFSAARWVPTGPPQAGGEAAGQLQVVTTRMRPGYIRKNGVPYSANARLTEYFVVLEAGATYLAVTTMVEDPQYLAQPWVRTSQFRKQPDGAGWNPTPCEVG